MNHTTDEVAIRALMQELRDCWAAGDAAAFANVFSDDVDYVTFDGGYLKGREANIAAHKPLFERWLKGSHLVEQSCQIHFLAPDVALVHATGNTVMAGQAEPAPERASIQTLVATKADDTWRFTAFHITRIRPIGSGFGSIIAWRLADLFWKLLGAKNTGSHQLKRR